jgi:hypothetical protein
MPEKAINHTCTACHAYKTNNAHIATNHMLRQKHISLKKR